MRDNLEMLWRDAFEEYDQRKQAAERQVVRWEWTSGLRYDPRPFYFQRFPARGRALAAEPTDKSQGAWQYGFNQQGRTVVLRTYDGQAEPFERFVRYEAGRIESVEYGGLRPRLPVKVSRVLLTAGMRMVAYEELALPLDALTQTWTPDALAGWRLNTNGLSKVREHYQYDGDDRMVKLVYEREQAAASDNFKREETTVYDADGRLERIDAHYAGGHTAVVYQRPHKG
jgi:hypothetical protein